MKHLLPKTAAMAGCCLLLALHAMADKPQKYRGKVVTALASYEGMIIIDLKRGVQMSRYKGVPHLITDIAPLESAAPHAISFLASPKFVCLLASSQAGCVIVSPQLQEAAQARGAVIVTPDPYLYFARLTQWWALRVRPAAAA